MNIFCHHKTFYLYDIQENNIVLVHSRSHYSWTKIACAASHQVSPTTGEPPLVTNLKAKLKPMVRAEEANLGGSVLPRQQSALLCEAIAVEPKG